MRSSGFRGSFVTGFVLLCCLRREIVLMFHHGCRMASSGHVLEPRDDVDQIKNKSRTVVVPRTYGMLERLERKSTTVKGLAGLWGASVRFPVESPVRARS